VPQTFELQEDILNIHRDISQNINCNKLSLNLLLKETFVSDCRYFPDIYISQGSVATRFRCGEIINESSLHVYC